MSRFISLQVSPNTYYRINSPSPRPYRILGCHCYMARFHGTTRSVFADCLVLCNSETGDFVVKDKA